jgi:hypothetical protein
MDEPVNGAYATDEVPPEPKRPLYVAGYRIPTDKVWMFLVANIAFVVGIIVLTIFYIPLGIPFLAVKQSNGFVSYVGFFFVYVFGYIAFLMIVLTTLGISGYAVQQRYFPGYSLPVPETTPADSTSSTAAPVTA